MNRITLSTLLYVKDEDLGWCLKTPTGRACANYRMSLALDRIAYLEEALAAQCSLNAAPQGTPLSDSGDEARSSSGLHPLVSTDPCSLSEAHTEFPEAPSAPRPGTPS